MMRRMMRLLSSGVNLRQVDESLAGRPALDTLVGFLPQQSLALPRQEAFLGGL